MTQQEDIPQPEVTILEGSPVGSEADSEGGETDIIPAGSGPVAVFSPLSAIVVTLRQRYENVAFDMRTVKGNEAARAARKELSAISGRADRAYAAWNQPILAEQKRARELRDAIKAEALLLEAPIDAQIKADEARREEEARLRKEAEAKRNAEIRARLLEIGRAAAGLMSAPPETIAAKIAEINAIEVSEESFGVFVDDATSLIAEAKTSLDAAHAGAVARVNAALELAKAQERLEIERAALRKQAEELAAARKALAEAEEKAAAEAARAEAERIEAERKAASEQESERARIEAEALEAARQVDAFAEEIPAAAKAVAEEKAEVKATFGTTQRVIPIRPVEKTVGEVAADAGGYSESMASRPADWAITDAVAAHFKVEAAVAARWIGDYDFFAESERVANETARAS